MTAKAYGAVAKTRVGLCAEAANLRRQKAVLEEICAAQEMELIAQRTMQDRIHFQLSNQKRHEQLFTQLGVAEQRVGVFNKQVPLEQSETLPGRRGSLHPHHNHHKDSLPERIGWTELVVSQNVGRELLAAEAEHQVARRAWQGTQEKLAEEAAALCAQSARLEQAAQQHQRDTHWATAGSSELPKLRTEAKECREALAVQRKNEAAAQEALRTAQGFKPFPELTLHRETSDSRQKQLVAMREELIRVRTASAAIESQARGIQAGMLRSSISTVEHLRSELRDVHLDCAQLRAYLEESRQSLERISLQAGTLPDRAVKEMQDSSAMT